MSLAPRKSDFFMADVEGQFRWYEAQANEEVARRYLVAVNQTLAKLPRQPDLGRKRHFRHVELQGLRSMRVERPYEHHLLFYRYGVLATPDERRRFATEAEAASTLDHPGILRVHRVGQHEGQWFLEMELVEGGTLADRLTEGPLPPREAAQLLTRLARAVQHAHARGILHRDLKPANVLLAPDGQPKLTDFGLARFLDRDSNLTRTLDVLGTPAYMAPEIAAGHARHATVAADIYSLGVILFECLTGERPFKGNTPLEVLRVVQDTPAPRPSSRRPGLPRDLEIITLRCLAREPERRFPSAGELADELDRFLNNRPIRSRAVSPAERLWLWCRRQPRLATAAGLVVLGVTTVLWQWQRAETANRRLRHQVALVAIRRADGDLVGGHPGTGAFKGRYP